MIRNILIVVSLLLASCNMDIPLEDEISGDAAIDNVHIAREALNAAYYNYPKEALTFSILSDDLQPTYLINKNAELKKLYDWNAIEISILSKEIWASYYHTISQLNTVLKSEKYISLEQKSEAYEWDSIKGEAYALKAMAYFELLRIYSDRYTEDSSKLGIILKDNVELEFLNRSSVSKVVTEIEKLITKAKDLLKGKSQNVNYMNYFSTVLLEAKLMQYMNDDSHALVLAEEIINAIGYKDNNADKNKYKALWDDVYTYV